MWCWTLFGAASWRLWAPGNVYVILQCAVCFVCMNQSETTTALATNDLKPICVK